MQSKPEIVFTFPGCMGGVASFNYNIINFSRLIGEFHSRVILVNAVEDKLPLFLEKYHADEVVTFNYSLKDNRYHVLKRLNRVLGDAKGCIVTDNGLTVYAARLFNNPKTIYHLVHDFYYVGQVASYGDMVDMAIAHSSFFSDAVLASSPALFSGRSLYIPYGVQQLDQYPPKNNAVLKLVFLGRLDESKGVQLLYEIDKGLSEKNIRADWTIIGKGPLKERLLKQWDGIPHVEFYEPDTTGEVYQLLKKQDIFVFPTIFEGTPVAILEAISNGVVTITNDLPGGIRDIVTEGVGFRCRINDTGEYVEKISALHADRKRLDQLQHNCYALAQKSYDIRNNADHYFEQFLQYEKQKRDIKCNLVKLSRLDRPAIPNGLVKLIRNLK